MSGKYSKSVLFEHAKASMSALLLLLLLAACGDGGEGSANNMSVTNAGTDGESRLDITGEPADLIIVQPAIPPLATGPIHGFLTIEESSGKRVLDGWFESGPDGFEEQALTTVSANEPMYDVCTPTVASDQQSSLIRTRSRPADAIELVSRSGIQARLNYFMSYDTVVYATEQRWLSEPIADDTQVNLVGNPQFETLTPPMLSSLKRLELHLPLRPILDSATTTLDWVASDHPYDQVVLTVWPKSRSEITVAAPTLRCTLVDDGLFKLTDAIPEGVALKNSTFAFRMRRERRTEHQVDGMGWSIVQTSLAMF